MFLNSFHERNSKEELRWAHTSKINRIKSNPEVRDSKESKPRSP